MNYNWLFFMKNLLSLSVFLIITLGISAIVGYAIAPNINTWYAQLNHPIFAPPNWVFAPVWTLLYIMIAISGWIIYEKNAFTGESLLIWTIQLFLNFVWSFLFFNFHMLLVSLIEMTILLVFIVLNIRYFYQKSKLSGWLLMPYFCWVCFAWILNLMYWILN